MRGRHSVAELVAKAQAVLTEPELLRAIFDVSYFPPNAPAYRDRVDPFAMRSAATGRTIQRACVGRYQAAPARPAIVRQ